jgi:hypothetical protein
LFFGCRLPNHPNLRVMKGDIRDTKKPVEALQGQEVLHLACISNDASFELDEKLSEEGGRPAFCLLLVKLGLWVSDSPNVTEDHLLVALTLYNKFKGMCEPVAAQSGRLYLRRHPSCHDLRLKPAHAARSLRQHPHQSRGKQRHYHRLRR